MLVAVTAVAALGLTACGTNYKNAKQAECGADGKYKNGTWVEKKDKVDAHCAENSNKEAYGKADSEDKCKALIPAGHWDKTKEDGKKCAQEKPVETAAQKCAKHADDTTCKADSTNKCDWKAKTLKTDGTVDVAAHCAAKPE